MLNLSLLQPFGVDEVDPDNIKFIAQAGSFITIHLKNAVNCKLAENCRHLEITLGCTMEELNKALKYYKFKDELEDILNADSV